MSYSKEHYRRPKDGDYPRNSRNGSQYASLLRRNEVLEDSIKELKANLASAEKDIKYRVDKNHSLQRKLDSLSKSCNDNDILKRIIDNLEKELAATKNDLKSQLAENAAIKCKIDNESEESSKKSGTLNQIIKTLETEVKATKMKLKEQAFLNALADTESKNQIESLSVENMELKKQNESQIHEIYKVKQQIIAGRRELNAFEANKKILRKQFEDLDKIHKIQDNVMKTIQSSFSSHGHTEIDISQNNGQVADNTGSTLDPNARPLDFACQKCDKRYKQKNSLYRHIKEKHIQELQKEFLTTSAPKRLKRLNTML